MLANRSGEIGVVMTMGALHDGHRELIKVARRRCEVIVVTVFLNPLQFAPSEDLSRYPKTLDADVALSAEENVDLVFAPSVEEVYPAGEPQVRVHAGPLGDVLEGASRPGHFDGVLTVVAKLLHLTAPDVAYFGQKDAQQLLLISPDGRRPELPGRGRRGADRAGRRRAGPVQPQHVPRRGRPPGGPRAVPGAAGRSGRGRATARTRYAGQRAPCSVPSRVWASTTSRSSRPAP